MLPKYFACCGAEDTRELAIGIVALQHAWHVFVVKLRLPRDEGIGVALWSRVRIPSRRSVVLTKCYSLFVTPMMVALVPSAANKPGIDYGQVVVLS